MQLRRNNRKRRHMRRYTRTCSEGRKSWRYVGMVGIMPDTHSNKSRCYVPNLRESLNFGDLFWQRSGGQRRHVLPTAPCVVTMGTFRQVRVHHGTHLLTCLLGRADALFLLAGMRKMAISATDALDARKLKVENAWEAPPSGMVD